MALAVVSRSKKNENAMTRHFDFCEVFAGSAWQAGLVKSLLEDAGIRAFLKDEIINRASPWWASTAGSGPVKVLVAEGDEQEASGVVALYEKNTYHW